MPPALLLRGARHAKHDIFRMRASAICQRHISDGGLTPATETSLLLAAYRGGSHPSEMYGLPLLYAQKNGHLYGFMYILIAITLHFH